jgi:predicted RND superfamily exporter protein
MDAALISDILWYSTIGLTVVLLILYPLLGSKRQALYCWLVVVLGLFWVRGTVGILDLIGFELEGEPIKERVYILLVFTAVIIAGISFSTRKLDSYNSKRCDYPDLTRKNIWKMTQRFNGKIYIVAVIAIASFLTLYSIQIRGITEMGILSAFGIVYLVAMTKWLIPALQIVFGGDIKVNERGCLLKIGDRFLDIATKACFWILTRVSPKATFWIASFFALIIVFGALAIVAHDYKAHKIDEKMPLIKTGTNPIDYLRGTIVDRARLFLNDSERYGFGKLSVLVRPETGDVYNPEFIEKAYLLQKKAKEIEGIRTCKSVLDTVILISKKQYGLNYPETEQQVFDILSMIEWDLGSELFSQLIYSGGVNIVLSLTADNSDLMEKQSADMIELAERYGFIVQPFGRLHYYHQTDKYIQRGQPLNMMTSFWVVVIACCFWIGYRKLDFISSGSYELNSFMAGFAMVVPFVFASSCIVYLMVICDIPLDQSMACFTPLAINAAIDFNLHFMDDFNEALMSGEGYLSAMKTALVKKGKINIVDIVVNATCFAFLIFSNFSPISLLGWLLVIMMFACGFGALVIMPAILYICVRPVKKSII